MKFSCERCHRRFSTVDEPIAGRVYYIPCKCGHVVALRTDDAGAASPAATPAQPPPLPRAAAADPAWAAPPPPPAPEDAIPEVSGAVPIDDDPFARAAPDPLPATRRFDLASLAAGDGPPLARLDPSASPEELVDTRMCEAERDGWWRWRPRRATVLAAGGVAAFAVAVGAWVSVVSSGTTSLTVARSPRAGPAPLAAVPETTFDLAAPVAPAAPAVARAARPAPPAKPVQAPELIQLGSGADEHAALGEAPVAPQPILAIETPAAAPRAPDAAASPAAPPQGAPESAPVAAAHATARAPDARQVFETLRGRGDDLDECLAGSPDAVPAIAGKRFRLVVVVDPDGRVTDAAVDDPAVDATALGTCLRGVAYAMSFQPFEGGPARVRVPLKPDDAH